MPLILGEADRLSWLSGTEREARNLISQYPADEMQAYRIGSLVNNPGFDSSRILEPGSTG